MLSFLFLNLILLHDVFAFNVPKSTGHSNVETWRKSLNKNQTILPNAEVQEKKQLEVRSFRPKDVFFRNFPTRQYLPPSEISTTTTTISPTLEDNFFFHDEQMEVEPPLSFGYTYITPSIPFDELKPPHDEVPIPHDDYLPPHPTFHSANTFNPNENKNKIIPLHLEVNEMHCFDTQTDGRFQAVLTFRSNENRPVLEDMLYKNEGLCEVFSDQLPTSSDAKIHINIPKRDFQKCGVRDCSTGEDVVHMCVRLRFPIMSKMRLPEDPVLTLHCRTQDRVITQIKHLKVDVDNSVVARSGGVIAKGGNRGKLRTNVVLYRRGVRGDFTEVLPPRARVALGDTIMLRADVEPGDGWTLSRFSTTVMKRENAKNDDEEVVLLQNDGCRAPQAYLLCPKEPINLSPLSHSLFIRAALFEGMSSGEEVRLSVKLIACLDADECRYGKCEESYQRTRFKRSRQSKIGHQANTTSEVSFTIIVPDITDKSETSFNGATIYSLFTLCVIIICIAIIFVLNKIKDNLTFKRQKFDIGL